MAQQIQQDPEKTRKPIENFGKNPPWISFKDIISYLDKLVKNGGTTGSFDDLSKAVGCNSIGSSTFYTRSGALKNYGLLRLDRKNNTYAFESLGTMIAAGSGEDQRSEAIKKAFLNNSTIRKIWELYKGGIMPSRESLPHNLHSRLPEDVPKPLQESWAKYFYDGAEFAHFLDKRNNGNFLVSSEPNPEKTSSTPGSRKEQEGSDYAEKTAEIKDKKTTSIIPQTPDSNITNSKNLSSGRLIAFSAPEEPTREEAMEIEKFLKNQLKRNKGFTEDELENGQS